MEIKETDNEWKNNFPFDTREFWKQQAEIEKKLADRWESLAKGWEKKAKGLYSVIAEPKKECLNYARIIELNHDEVTDEELANLPF